MQVDSLKVVTNSPVYAISSQAQKGIKEVLRVLREQVVAARQANDDAVDEGEDIPTISLTDTAKHNAWEIRTEDGEDGEKRYRVTGRKIEKFAARTNFGQYQAVNRLRDIMKKMGITHELIRQGANGESTVRIGTSDFTLLEQATDED